MLGQKTIFIGKLPRQVFFDNVVEAPLSQRLLLGTHPHLEQLLDRSNPRRMSRNKGIVLQGVVGAFDIGRLQLVSRVLKTEIKDVLRCYAQELRPGYA